MHSAQIHTCCFARFDFSSSSSSFMLLLVSFTFDEKIRSFPDGWYCLACFRDCFFFCFSFSRCEDHLKKPFFSGYLRLLREGCAPMASPDPLSITSDESCHTPDLEIVWLSTHEWIHPDFLLWYDHPFSIEQQYFKYFPLLNDFVFVHVCRVCFSLSLSHCHMSILR